MAITIHTYQAVLCIPLLIDTMNQSLDIASIRLGVLLQTLMRIQLPDNTQEFIIRMLTCA